MSATAISPARQLLLRAWELGWEAHEEFMSCSDSSVDHAVAAILPVSPSASEVVCTCGVVMNTYATTAGDVFGRHLTTVRSEGAS